MATRNQRKRKALAKRKALQHSLDTLAACKAIDAAIAAKREAAIIAAHEWGRPIRGVGLTHSTPKAKDRLTPLPRYSPVWAWRVIDKR